MRSGVDGRAGRARRAAACACVVRGAARRGRIEGSHLLVATGRRPNVDGLDLDAAGISYDGKRDRGRQGLRTTNRRVYAIGDVAGGPQFTHVANYHAGLVIRNALFRLPVKVNDDSDPAGDLHRSRTRPCRPDRGARRARAQARIRVLRWPYHENDRAQAERETRGHIKVVTDPKGPHPRAPPSSGPAAGELITTWTLAISRRLNIRAFAGIVVPYPTLSEIGKRAAITYFTPSLTSTLVRRIIALVAPLRLRSNGAGRNSDA